VVAGRPQLLRALNEESLLNALRRGGPLMRADLTRVSGLSKPTVGLGLVNLERDGLVRVAGRRTGVKGPSALLYEVNPDAGYVLALDVGKEYLRGALADLAGTVRSRGHRKVHAARGYARMSELISLAGELVAATGVAQGDVTQVVVGSPGIYNRRTDTLMLAAGLPGWGQAGVVAELRRAFGLSTVVENDINLAALAERDHGHGRDVRTFAFVSVGTGIGMGLVLDGQLHKGVHGAVGEIGFLPLNADGLLDVSDARRRGPMEAAASAAGVVRAARRNGMGGRLSAQRVFEAAAAGDEAAVAVVVEEAGLVARAIASVVLVADPELVVLGGGIGSAPGFAEAVVSDLRRLVPTVPDLRVSALAGEAVVEGGLRLGIDMAWQRVLSRA
jgi:predicted NBD/HSP70 family sugar kinase